jgi:hypothetical protein
MVGEKYIQAYGEIKTHISRYRSRFNPISYIFHTANAMDQRGAEEAGGLIASQKFAPFYGTQSFTSVSTKAWHWIPF